MVMYQRILKCLIFSLVLISVEAYAMPIAIDDVVVNSDDLVVDKILGTAKFTGDVVICFDDAILKTTELTLLVTEDGVKRVLDKIILPSKLSAFNHSKNEVVVADGGEYIASEKLLKLTGNIYMQKDERLVKCDELIYVMEIKSISSKDKK